MLRASCPVDPFNFRGELDHSVVQGDDGVFESEELRFLWRTGRTREAVSGDSCPGSDLRRRFERICDVGSGELHARTFSRDDWALKHAEHAQLLW
jgi:hypothetical protein